MTALILRAIDGRDLAISERHAALSRRNGRCSEHRMVLVKRETGICREFLRDGEHDGLPLYTERAPTTPAHQHPRTIDAP